MPAPITLDTHPHDHRDPVVHTERFALLLLILSTPRHAAILARTHWLGVTPVFRARIAISAILVLARRTPTESRDA
jgi:hypothetical protein